jgi:hypothetical protein
MKRLVRFMLQERKVLLETASLLRVVVCFTRQVCL